MLYPWGTKRRFNSYSDYIKKIFSERVQKISIDAGFTCPNRDNTKGSSGCTYCNNTNFRPSYIKPQKSVTQQLNQGIAFFSKKYKGQKYLAYFQSFTNTYASLSILKSLYTEALQHPLVTGLVISTRPDAISEEILEYIRELSQKYYVAIEYGVESTVNRTLEKINRCHTYEDAEKAFELTALFNIQTGAHLILGLPGETREDILNHAKKISRLQVHTLKLHQLQINKNTRMYSDYLEHAEEFRFYNITEYVDLVIDFLELLNPAIIVERFASESPINQLVIPKWGLKNFEIVSKIEKRLEERDTWQGKKY
ncbi:MAG: TIGR01212 family radical SAM protein [Chlorobi bacterium]|nr:TIGR01212 family radical SAM protein [Chlorobiota bacterium]